MPRNDFLVFFFILDEVLFNSWESIVDFILPKEVSMTVWILLPAYNEGKSFPFLLPRIKSVMEKSIHKWRIVILDDGSNDDTVDILESHREYYPIDLIKHEINRGLGETERDLFEYVAMNADAEDVAVRLDCDDTHDPSFITDMIEKMNGSTNVVIASRYQKGGGQDGLTAFKYFLTTAASIYMRIFFPMRGVKDYSCGFRMYKIRLLQDALAVYGNNFIQMKGLGFTSTLETIVKLDLLGATFAEVPFHLHYSRKISASKMVNSLTTLGYFIMTFLQWWPFGGWRSCYRGLSKLYREKPMEALGKFGVKSKRRPLFSRIGGGGV